MADNPALTLARTAIALAAIATPTLLAYNVAPSPTFLNQALALGLWGLFVAVSRPARPAPSGWPLLAALGVLASAALGAWALAGLPASLALSALGLLLAATVVACAGSGVRVCADAPTTFATVCWALALTASVNVAVACVQVFWPGLTDSEWLAATSIAGRAVGNLRQPNHLSSVLTWGCVAVVGLFELRRIGPRWAVALLAAMVVAIVLTASRTGLLSVLVLVVWALVDRRLHRASRALLLAAPLIYALAWWGMAQWAAASAHAFGGEARLAETDISGSRFAIWANTLDLIRQQPWLGVGFGEFNFAWSLTPFPNRPIAFFDHSHNLPLQLAVELGLPLATLVMGLLLWALWRAAAAAWLVPVRQATSLGAGAGADTAVATESALNVAQRCAVVMVLMIGLHSLLEYPLWYAYFLLPTAWLFGFALPSSKPATPAATSKPAKPATPAAPQPPSGALVAAGLLLMVGAVLSVVDYARVVAIFKAPENAGPLTERVANGQRSVLFAHHANYAAATSNIEVADRAAAFRSATHYLLDTRLTAAWAEALAANGRTDEARHVAQRLREFRRTESNDFFEACPISPKENAAVAAAAATPASAPFQCQAPSRNVNWRELRR